MFEEAVLVEFTLRGLHSPLVNAMLADLPRHVDLLPVLGSAKLELEDVNELVP